ncbi:MAG: GNAT family N-acetyltransferase [Bacteroidota bacterium]
MIQVRSATPDDLPAIYDLVYELALYEKAPQALTATLADYQRDFANGLFEALVAERAGLVLGMALYYDTYSTWKGRMLYLEDFVVRESQRGQGIGQLLFDGFLRAARERQARLVKWQVLDWNEPALRFYEKNRAIIERNWWNGKIFLEAKAEGLS